MKKFLLILAVLTAIGTIVYAAQWCQQVCYTDTNGQVHCHTECSGT